jgi:hypothetical protein
MPLNKVIHSTVQKEIYLKNFVKEWLDISFITKRLDQIKSYLTGIFIKLKINILIKHILRIKKQRKLKKFLYLKINQSQFWNSNH